MPSMQLEIWDAKLQKLLFTLKNVDQGDTVLEVKHAIYLQKPKLYPSRQALRLEPRGRALKDDEKLTDLNLPARNALLYVRDLGMQIGWQTVFLIEYAGPFFIYPLFYLRPSLIYGDLSTRPMDSAVNLALVCWSIHYGKRLLETVFVHRFSKDTMPIGNLFKNCSYYWGFAALIAYFVNHPLFTPPDFGRAQIAVGLSLFAVGELGNFFCHMVFRNLRKPGSQMDSVAVSGHVISKTRVIPRSQSSNPFTWLFNYVSCPNYTYEAVAWLGFSVLTQTLPALVFTTVGFVQMSLWALGKHRNYKKEFADYPRRRTAIVPFLL